MASDMTQAADVAIARLLFVRRGPEAPAAAAAADAVATRAFNVSLLFSATRCTLMYVVLPLLLPIFGVIHPPLPLLMVCDLGALCGVIYSLRRLWRLRSPARWRYLPLACMSMMFMAVFLANDLAAAHI